MSYVNLDNILEITLLFSQGHQKDMCMQKSTNLPKWIKLWDMCVVCT